MLKLISSLLLLAYFTYGNVVGSNIKRNLFDPSTVDFPSTYAEINGTNYYFSERISVNWTEAFKLCQDMNMTLISFETLEEYEFVAEYLFAEGDTLYRHASGKRPINDTQWYWTYNNNNYTEFVDSETMWGPGQPSNDLNVLDCMNFEVGFGWDDDICDVWSMAYACEQSDE